jgi:hypothetical protein
MATNAKRASALAGRRNKKAAHSFSHDSAKTPEPARPPRAQPSLQAELLLKGITIDELTERRNAFDNDERTTDADRYASAIMSYLNKQTSTVRREQWCVIPGFKFDARKSEIGALERAGWAGHARAYQPEEWTALCARFDQLTVKARERLLEETKAYPHIHRLVGEMGTSWVPRDGQEQAAREIVTEWLMARVSR